MYTAPRHRANTTGKERLLNLINKINIRALLSPQGGLAALVSVSLFFAYSPFSWSQPELKVGNFPDDPGRSGDPFNFVIDPDLLENDQVQFSTQLLHPGDFFNKRVGVLDVAGLSELKEHEIFLAKSAFILDRSITVYGEKFFSNGSILKKIYNLSSVKKIASVGHSVMFRFKKPLFKLLLIDIESESTMKFYGADELLSHAATFQGAPDGVYPQYTLRDITLFFDPEYPAERMTVCTSDNITKLFRKTVNICRYSALGDERTLVICYFVASVKKESIRTIVSMMNKPYIRPFVEKYLQSSNAIVALLSDQLKKEVTQTARLMESLTKDGGS